MDDLRVHYKRAGSGPTVVLLHGSGSSLHGFEAVADLLVPSFDVIRPDLPGFGLTGPHPHRDYHISTFSTIVARFLSTVGVTGAAVAGNSLGGNIAWNLALDQPRLVTALVLINATG
ncbi:alpha/beta fold hydrolase [Actinoplanes subtropicus]|uniref:alpha/beta fold hydrolase n=1 Tax=Actinoplanes subtropicus TaxID=543632 RepID=UPI000A8D6855|nr:alpha/beta hydrolase [Actinoplanes subtropicus]